jgi:hypothetical protein
LLLSRLVELTGSRSIRDHCRYVSEQQRCILTLFPPCLLELLEQ